MANILNIETSTTVCSVALSSEGQIVDHHENYEGLNDLRRQFYAKNKEAINEQKRSAYEKRVERNSSAVEEVDV